MQALALLNNKFMEHYAERFTERLRRESPDNVDSQIRRAYLLAFSREPDDDETTFARKFVDQHGLNQLCLVLFNLNEFAYVD